MNPYSEHKKAFLISTKFSFSITILYKKVINITHVKGARMNP